MIQVKVKRAAFGVEEVTISGHANAAEYGEDIVCAAVSALSLGTLNAVHMLLQVTPDVDMAEQGGGFLRWKLHLLDDVTLHEKQQLLAESMIVSLAAVSHKYRTFVTLYDNKWQGGAQ